MSLFISLIRVWWVQTPAPAAVKACSGPLRRLKGILAAGYSPVFGHRPARNGDIL